MEEGQQRAKTSVDAARSENQLLHATPQCRRRLQPRPQKPTPNHNVASCLALISRNDN